MIRIKSLLLIFISVTGVAQAHGVHDTASGQGSAERPKRLFEFFIPGLNAKADMRIDEQGGYRYIESDGLANHATGRFPNTNNPNAIRSQDYNFRVRLKPTKRGASTEVGHNSFGVAINGVPFDAATAEYWNNDRSSDWNIEAMSGAMNLGLDQNNAHVQPNGAYHYHSIPIGLVEQYDYRSQPALIGYAADGFPVYSPYGYKDANDPASGMVNLKASYRVRQGTRPGGPGGRYDGTYTRDYEYVDGLGDLDQCNGRSGVTPDYPDGTYYYVITDSYPYIPRCWMGNADSSFFKGPGSGPQGGQQRGRGPGGPGGAGGPGGRKPPREAISACSGKRDGATCSFRAPHGNVRGACRNMGGEIACVPSGR